MDIQNLQTFLAVAKLGSFTKAAEQNFISATAVMKQINKLESELGCTLLERSSAGIRLKPEGEVFLTYAQQLIELAHQAYLACHATTNHVFTLRLGTSLLHPSRPFLSIWNRIKGHLPQYSLTIVPLPSDLVTQNREYEALGKSCDILIGTFDQATTHTLVDAIPLGSYRFSIAVRSDNPLAEKKALPSKIWNPSTCSWCPGALVTKTICSATGWKKNYPIVRFSKRRAATASIPSMPPSTKMRPSSI